MYLSQCYEQVPISLIIFCFSFSPQELQKEKNTLTVQLDQSSRRLSQLEEEKKSTDQNLKRTQGQLDDLKGKFVLRMAVAEARGYFRELSEMISVFNLLAFLCLQLSQRDRLKS